MTRTAPLALWFAALLLLPAAAAAHAPSAQVLAAPSPVVLTDDRRHLVYEVVVRNPAAERTVVRRVAVLDQDRRVLAAFGPASIARLLGPSGMPLVPAPEIEPGGRLILFLDLALPRGRRVPSRLQHRFVIGSERLKGAGTEVERGRALRVGPPLRTDRLLAIIAHAPVTIDDRLSHAQRYAIDFARLNEQGDNVFTGDPTRNESYAIYGAEVVAVAPGTITAMRDDLPDNTPPTEPPFTGWENVAGNRVVQDLGDGRYALYAHMQPGSVRVRVGQRVERGQVLGLVGNSGISSGPHLHFHVMDGPGGPSGLDANGLPYVFDRFDHLGRIADLTAPVLTPAPPPPERLNRFPRSGDVLAFSPRSAPGR